MSINPTDFYNQLVKHNVGFFTGVPDSLLKEFCLCIDDNVSDDRHVIAANEGKAKVALAALKGDKTMSELSSFYTLNPGQI